MTEVGVKGHSLHGYSREGNIAGMIQLLNSRENVNARDKYQRTPLHLAAYEGKLDSAKLLIEFQANVHLMAQDNTRPLHFAVQKGHIDMVKLLLSNGAESDINAPMKNQKTCVHLAAEKNNAEMLKLLLNRGGNPNMKNKKNQTPFDVTTDEECKKLLTEAIKRHNQEKNKKKNDNLKRRLEENDKDDKSDSKRIKVEENNDTNLSIPSKEEENIHENTAQKDIIQTKTDETNKQETRNTVSESPEVSQSNKTIIPVIQKTSSNSKQKKSKHNVTLSMLSFALDDDE
ncbi:hypothetical protein WA158_003023 [Blastocystis sp. Blastoise]